LAAVDNVAWIEGVNALSCHERKGKTHKRFSNLDSQSGREFVYTVGDDLLSKVHNLPTYLEEDLTTR
jgi:hypothetical protein